VSACVRACMLVSTEFIQNGALTILLWSLQAAVLPRSSCPTPVLRHQQSGQPGKRHGKMVAGTKILLPGSSHHSRRKQERFARRLGCTRGNVQNEG